MSKRVIDEEYRPISDSSPSGPSGPSGISGAYTGDHSRTEDGDYDSKLR